MSCNYTIKHYWDELEKSTTIEPEWLRSGGNLSSEKKAIKKLYENTLGNATYYNKLIASKVESEEMNGYKIKYIYLEKDDPLHKNSRKVTDISMCINIPIQLPKKGLLYSTFFILMTFFLGYYLLNRSTVVPEIQEIQSNKKKSEISVKVKKENI